MNMIKNTVQFVVFLAMAASIAPGYAEDIDIYARPPTATQDPALNPNVLIVIDNSANWAAANQHWPGGVKQGESELNALRTVIGELSDRTNVGLMMFTPGGGGAGAGGRGGYVRFHVRQMTPDNKAAFSELVGYPSGCVDGLNSVNDTPNCILKNFNDPSEKVSAAQTDYSAMMLEVFKYFGGYTHPAHAQDDVAGAPVDEVQFGNERYAGLDSKADPHAFTDSNKDVYKSPVTAANSCSKNYVIFIGNGFPSQDSPSTLLGPVSLLPNQGVGGDVTQLPLANLASATTTQTVLLATPACGTYPGATAMESLGACNADPTLSTQYPGYSSYACTSASTCSAGSTTTSTTNLGTSACAIYIDEAACKQATATKFPSYGSHSCTNKTACTSSKANTDDPKVTDCISNNLNNAANCTAYGNDNYSGYAGFSCTSLGTTGCTGGDKKWQIDATTKVTTGSTWVMNGINQTTVSSTTFSQYINGTYTTIAAEPDGTFSAPTKINHFDEWARFLNQTDVSSAPGKQNINTFTIDVFKDQQDLDETSLLISAASAGGGKYFKASDEAAIENALRKIFSEIQSVNSVFASSSLPVSVNTQGTYLNQVFMGMFRPEGSAAPRWPGNVKQYQFKLFGGELRLADKDGQQAVSTTTGFITPCANSFWATDTGNYWNFGASAAVGGCSAQTSAFPANSTSVFSDAPDGDVVEKGGAAQRLRGVYSSGGTLVSSSTNYEVCGAGQTPATASCRLLFTCDGSSPTSCGALTGFDTANAAIDATALNLADATQRDNLIDWIRGKDVDNENANLDTSVTPAVAVVDEVRPSVHGGVVHAQPAVIDYGGTTIAFYGADDGVFHAINGGQSDTDGIELWGFIAPEIMGKLNRLRTNSPSIAFPGVSGSPAPLPKDYFFDGSVGVYQKIGAGGVSEKVWIFPSMRRGGRAIYAFDVSDPASPVLKWRKGCFTNDTTDNTACSPDSVTPSRWASIGQTWSKPQIVYLDKYMDGSSQPKPVLVFGGGYDQCEDANSQTRCATTPRKGANIWFVDADTGTILRTYPTDYSVPGDLTLLTDANGYLTYVYAADTGGNIYRINAGDYDGASFGASWSNNSAASQILLARLSETNHARKFMSGPAIVKTASFNAVLLGSGDREHPLVTDYACNQYSETLGNYVTNQFYMLMDKTSAYPSPAVTASDLVDVTIGTTSIAQDASGTVTISNVRSGVTKTSTKGWRFDFGRCEQSVNKALVVAGVTYFGTNAPSPVSATSCTANLGYAFGYAVDYLTGNPIPSSKELAQALAEAAGASNTLTGVGLVGEVVGGGSIMGTDGSVAASRHSAYIGGGMPPSPVSGVVEVDGTKYPFCIGCIDPSKTNNSASEAQEPPIYISSRRYKSYWYIEND